MKPLAFVTVLLDTARSAKDPLKISSQFLNLKSSFDDIPVQNLV